MSTTKVRTSKQKVNCLSQLLPAPMVTQERSSAHITACPLHPVWKRNCNAISLTSSTSWAATNQQKQAKKVKHPIPVFLKTANLGIQESLYSKVFAKKILLLTLRGLLFGIMLAMLNTRWGNIGLVAMTWTIGTHEVAKWERGQSQFIILLPSSLLRESASRLKE